MSNSAAEPSLTADERYLKSLTYGLILSTGLLSLIVVSLRLYTRAVIVNLFGLDDIAVCIALVVTQCFNGLGIAVVYYGEGRHFETVSAQDRAIWLKVLLKQALAAFDLTITNATCYSQFKLFQIVLYQAVLIFVADIIMLIAPMSILCGLQMPVRKIAALMAIFGTGIIACIAPVVRFSTLDYLRKGTTDLTYDSASSLYWMVIEFNLGLVAGSLSSLKPLPFFRRFGSSANSKYTESTGNEPHELAKFRAGEFKNNRKKGGLGMGTTLLEESVNESQERIILSKPL
ncbi:uncharacterized protein N7477_006744 [Penicillium maclennaniae]|uniref:uncharacterized protein n=1 Tax=Penicillium maclennaniae TaxID=1343394 RepID=UPI002540085C|nr:uncharacterized protein N7477_006744 [Penicillium maclennaniae]KAJ5668174.1 hypothetical protein N7477_006744 [Penicillium maclennaniae]